MPVDAVEDLSSLDGDERRLRTRLAEGVSSTRTFNFQRTVHDRHQGAAAALEALRRGDRPHARRGLGAEYVKTKFTPEAGKARRTT